MVKIMLAYYNDLTVLLSSVFNELGFEVFYVGRPGRKALSYATKYSSESWCFDMKIMLGQALEGLYNNCDIIVMPGAWGGKNQNCFLGYLTKGVMQKKLEKIVKKNVNIWFFNINAVEIIFSGYTAVYNNLIELKKYCDDKGFRRKVFSGLVLGTQKMKMVSSMNEIFLSSADVIDKKELFLIYDNFIEKMIFNADNLEKARDAYSQALDKINNLSRKDLKKKITIGIVGDFAHTLFSFYPFMDIERYLLMQDVFVKQPLNFTNYYSFLSPIYEKKLRNELKEIFPQSVTGSDAVTILSSLYLKDKVDGLIHIRTFSCTPEEVANEVLLFNKEKFPPILSLSCDEHTTEENLKVRIEAFIDMIHGGMK